MWGGARGLALARRRGVPIPRLVLVASFLLASFGGLGAAAAGGGLELGFAIGRRDYHLERFTRTEGDTTPSLVSTFEGDPFSGLAMAGVGLEWNLAIDGLRVAYGYDKLYPQGLGPISAHDPATAAVTSAQVRRMVATEHKLGLGWEQRVRPVFLSLDLVGTIGTVETDIAIGERQGTYESTGFGFGLRAGVRYPFRKGVYLHAAGEAALSGAPGLGVTFGIAVGGR